LAIRADSCTWRLISLTDDAISSVADATDSQSFAAGLPHGLQRSVLAPLGARVARLRGYELRI
jgi:hypothetical protein